MTATGPAPSKQAESDAALVIAFVNTVDEEERTDLLGREDSWRQWARAHGDERVDQVGTARDLRRALRTAIAGGAPPAVAGPSVRVELSSGVPALVGDTIVGTILAAAARLAATGEWSRLKICPAEDCGWAFHDGSRNRSRTWCSMRICGNRAKARNWRLRNR